MVLEEPYSSFFSNQFDKSQNLWVFLAYSKSKTNHSCIDGIKVLKTAEFWTKWDEGSVVNILYPSSYNSIIYI